MPKKGAWMVRAGNNNELIEDFYENGWAAIGWPDLGDLSELETRSDVKDKYQEVYEKHSEGKRNVNAGQLYRFSHKIEEGDFILSYDKSSRQYIIGEVTGDYEFAPDEAGEEYPNVIPVDWRDRRIDRDDFSTPAKNTLGGTMTVFSLDDIINEIHQVLSGEQPGEEEEDAEEDSPPFHVDVESKADELISDIIAHVDNERFEDLVAEVLRAMDYEAKTTRAGGDHGIDVIAHPDPFGFDDPYIKVQVKHVSSNVGSSELRDFIGTLGDDEVGLFVSTGGYTNDAREESKRTDHRITLLDRDEFVDLLLEHYDKLGTEYTNLVPLTRVYVPTEEPL